MTLRFECGERSNVRSSIQKKACVCGTLSCRCVPTTVSLHINRSASENHPINRATGHFASIFSLVG